MKTILIVLFILPFICLSQEKIQFAVGANGSVNSKHLPLRQLGTYGEVGFLQSRIFIRASVGIFLPKNTETKSWNGRMMAFGTSLGFNYRPITKRYQPGLLFQVQTMVPTSSTSLAVGDITKNVNIEGAAVRSIPFSFSPKFVQLIWFDKIGLELGVGYRYYLRHLQSEVLANFYRPLHSIELSLGLKFRLN